MNIEISYLIVFTAITILGILSITRKMSLGIGIVGMGVALVIGYFLSIYMNIVLLPVSQAIFYGGVWGIPAILGLVHMATLIWIVIVAGYNLMSSGGKITWA